MPTPSRKKTATKSRAPLARKTTSKKSVVVPPPGVVEVGANAPDFTLSDSSGTVHHLAALRGSQVILFFYPKDDTSDCTAQACAFETKRATLKRRGVVLLAVSPDPAKTHVKFATKHGLHFPLLVDERDSIGTPRVCNLYGVWHEKSMYGNKYMGVVRTTYLIGRNGRVSTRWDRVKVEGHVDQVMAALDD